MELYEDGKLELYNLKHDISEQKDLAPGMPDRAKEMHGMLKSWRESVNAQMAKPNPAWDPSREDYGYWWKLNTAPK